MSILVEVKSKEKNCTVIINLDHVIEIAPLNAGGCEIKMSDDGVSRSVIRVDNNYSEFQQFVMQTVTTEHISKRIEAIHKAAGTESPEKRRGRPAKDISLSIPKFDGSVPSDE